MSVYEPECTCDLMAHPCEIHDTDYPTVVRGPNWSPYCTCGHHQSEHRKGGDECNPCGANGEGEDASPNCARFESVSDVRPAERGDAILPYPSMSEELDLEG